MSLSVYVMPIWKFKCGDFSSPLERFAAGFEIKPKTVGLGGTVSAPQRPRLLERWRARRETRRLRTEIRAQLGRTVRWNDEGDVVYSEQSHGFEALRAYARWLDLRDRFPTFDPPPEDNYYKHPVVSVQDVSWTYPQVVDHDCYSGYFLAAEFDRLAEVEPYTVGGGRWTFTRSVGSTPRLLTELAGLGRELNVDEHWQWNGDDPLIWVKAAFSQLLTIAKLSRDHNLPIIFCG